MEENETVVPPQGAAVATPDDVAKALANMSPEMRAAFNEAAETVATTDEEKLARDSKLLETLRKIQAAAPASRVLTPDYLTASNPDTAKNNPIAFRKAQQRIRAEAQRAQALRVGLQFGDVKIYAR